jgi:hypothetical protein
MIRDDINLILNEILPDNDIKNNIDKLVTVGSSSILALHFITALEENFNIEFDNDHINHKFFSDFDYIEEVINTLR